MAMLVNENRRSSLAPFVHPAAIIIVVDYIIVIFASRDWLHLASIQPSSVAYG